ncbi:MAG: carboxypeptidase-like regulatory domain-containing protein, partial [Tenacibaculum sp.]
MQPLLLFSLAFILFTVSLSGQQRNASVVITVIDQKTKEPLTGAHIVGIGASGKKFYALSDINGRAVFTKVSAGSFNLKISYIGFKTVERTTEVVFGENKLKVALLEQMADYLN